MHNLLFDRYMFLCNIYTGVITLLYKDYMNKTISIIFEEKVLKRFDEEKDKKKVSRNWIIDYLLKKWFKDDCKIIMED